MVKIEKKLYQTCKLPYFLVTVTNFWLKNTVLHHVSLKTKKIWKFPYIFNIKIGVTNFFQNVTNFYFGNLICLLCQLLSSLRTSNKGYTTHSLDRQMLKSIVPQMHRLVGSKLKLIFIFGHAPTVWHAPAVWQAPPTVFHLHK